MPHIVVKMIEGRSHAQKQELSDRLAEALMAVLGSKDEPVSVAIENIPNDKWESDVFLPEIRGRKETLFKKPGYALVD